MGTMLFGTQDDLNCIVDIPLKGGANEPLCLGFKVSLHFFVGGIYVSDGGYILRVRNNSKSFYEMPQGQELADYQVNGMIPTPLPAYSVPVFDYLFGYSLWIILGVMGAFVAIRHAVRKRRLPKADVGDGAGA
jgi:hypothetical protein